MYFFSDTSEWTEVLLLRKMVKVISVHHFLSQDVTAIPGPTAGMSQSIDSEKNEIWELETDAKKIGLDQNLTNNKKSTIFELSS